MFAPYFSSYFIGEQYPSEECSRRGLYQPSIHVNSAVLASALVLQLRRSSSSHSSVAKKLSAMTDDQWAGLSLAELLAAREALDAKIQAVRSEARDAAIAQIRELMATYDLSQADVMPGAAAGVDLFSLSKVTVGDRALA